MTHADTSSSLSKGIVFLLARASRALGPIAEIISSPGRHASR